MPLLRSLPVPGPARATALAVATVSTAALLGGCTGTGAPKSAGHTPVASAPAQLWPKRPPAPPPTPDTESYTGPTPVPGLPEVSSGDIRKVSALSVVNAQDAADARASAPAFEDATLKKIARCTDAPKSCPVRAPEYHDLTGDGKDELIIGIESGNHILTVWAYMLKNGVVNRILDTAGTATAVEVAEGDLIMREPADKPGYETRTVHAWDAKNQIMVIRETEYDRRTPSSGSSASPGPERTR
ncbi:hypothetical protein [Streptomyces chattanoogensis]|uniref:hypothetical protein n=1 Tax=Streptomyces chattanoogensis TaxID=66876 RepID=UPI001FDEA420|nr:hypothetical protein [Streptomyces chattanoogensis]